MLMLMMFVQSSWAAEAPPAAPAPVAANNTQAEAAQFQSWLNNNGHAAPSASSNIPPAPLNTAPAPAATEQPSEEIPPAPINKHIPAPPKRVVHVQSIKLRGGSEPVVQSAPMSYRQSQAIMLQSTPSTPASTPDSDAAFNMMMQQNVPLNPQQVVRLRQMIDNSQRAASIPPTVPPKPVSSTLMINLAPGATPPAIRLAQGYVSSLVFVDSSGSPWPVAAYDMGDPKATNIQWDGKSNILLVQAITPYSAGNLVIRLVGLQTPITLELVSGQRVVDYRTDLHVPGIGPNTTDLPTGTGLPNSANQVLLSVLDGVAPPGSRQLMVRGGDCQAWLVGDTMYLRTRMTVLSPGWVGKMASPDGMYAYELQRTSSVLVSLYGDPVELKIEGF